MSGGSNGVGRKGYLARYIGSRVQSNQKYCGPVMYQGQIWRTNTKPCVKKAPRTQSFNSGVGHKGNPRFACNKTCSTDKTDAKMDSLTAFRILKAYITKKYKGAGSLILVAKRETLTSDHVGHPEKFSPIKHFYKGSLDYSYLSPIEKLAADVFEGLNEKFPLKEGGTPVLHVAGYATHQAQAQLLIKGYGWIKQFGPNESLLVCSFNQFFTDIWERCFIGIPYFVALALFYCLAVSASTLALFEVTFVACMDFWGIYIIPGMQTIEFVACIHKYYYIDIRGTLPPQ